MKEYKYKINGNEYNVTINSIEGNIANVEVNGKSYKVEMADKAPAHPVSMPKQETNTVSAPPAPSPSMPPTSSKPTTAGKHVNSPLPGVIIEVSVKEGQSVKAGEKVAVIEAMKMENEIQADADGTITKIHVNKGDSVLEGAPIVTIG